MLKLVLLNQQILLIYLNQMKQYQTLCNHYPQGSEHTYYDWFWGIGFRNIHDQKYASSCKSRKK